MPEGDNIIFYTEAKKTKNSNQKTQIPSTS
jgi:hypothetical protein